MPSSLKFRWSLNYFPAHHPAATNSMHLQYSIPTPHIYSTFPVGGAYEIQSNSYGGAF